MKSAIAIVFLFVFTYLHAQTDLEVHCLTDSSGTGVYSNQVLLDGNIFTYGMGLNPKFMVVVFDTICESWIDNYDSTNVYGSDLFGTNGLSWNHLTYDQQDPTKLTYLDSMINFWIPVDHAFVIYTPMQYSGSQTATLCPALAQTFQTRWGPSAVQSESIMILFGIQGQSSSYQMDTLTFGNVVDFQTQICKNLDTTNALNNLDLDATLLKAFPNPSSSTIQLEILDSQITTIDIFDWMGRLISTIQLTAGQKYCEVSNLSSGSYFVIANKGNDRAGQVKFVITN